MNRRWLFCKHVDGRQQEKETQHRLGQQPGMLGLANTQVTFQGERSDEELSEKNVRKKAKKEKREDYVKVIIIIIIIILLLLFVPLCGHYKNKDDNNNNK